jgi:hypothetical protein
VDSEKITDGTLCPHCDKASVCNQSFSFGVSQFSLRHSERTIMKNASLLITVLDAVIAAASLTLRYASILFVRFVSLSSGKNLVLNSRLAR